MNWLGLAGFAMGILGGWCMYGYSRNQAGSRVYGMPPKLELTRAILKRSICRNEKEKKRRVEEMMPCGMRIGRRGRFESFKARKESGKEDGERKGITKGGMYNR